jgi:hypothetical protein
MCKFLIVLGIVGSSLVFGIGGIMSLPLPAHPAHLAQN